LAAAEEEIEVRQILKAVEVALVVAAAAEEDSLVPKAEQRAQAEEEALAHKEVMEAKDTVQQVVAQEQHLEQMEILE
jgi:hypothetical protein